MNDRSHCKKPREARWLGVRRHAEYNPITPFHSSPEDAGKAGAGEIQDVRVFPAAGGALVAIADGGQAQL